ncbi:DUF6660 family protein [Sphingobacterium corticibacter]|uniref:DUF6660 family protein n=1 Tax=Sphingobacterium corticibacter TaxID=2171749 RepID=UPI0037446878
MRLITMLLLTYLMALIVMPCSDAVAVVRADDLPELYHQHNENTTDSCSPFCTCPCCGISIEHPSYYNLEISTPLFSCWTVEPVIEQFVMADTFLPSVWQPPKY